MRVVTFGEIMLRLAPNGNLRFLQSESFEALFGGAEANVAVGLANFGIDSAFVTKLPKHEIGQAAVNSLRRYGVDTCYIARGGDRVGIYYCEKGAGPRPGKVIYDRAGSAVSLSEASDYDFTAALKGADWFHITGITAGVVKTDIIIQALEAAKEAGATVSIDYNYRSKLWTRDEMKKVMRQIVPYADVFIGGETDACDLLGEKPDDPMRTLYEKYGFRAVASTSRESISASDNIIGARLITDGKEYFSKKYPVRIVDRVGGGDAFDAGLIYAMLNGYEPQYAVEFAVASSCLKHTVEGDFCIAEVSEAAALADGKADGRVLR